MPTISPFISALFLLLSCAPHFLSSTPFFFPLHRRFLHQPFFPLDTDSFPPSQPPSPSPPSPLLKNPKFPLSTSTPYQSPFFPSYPAPPPPPSPTTFASFPANISSLVIPNSPSPKPTSHKLLALTVAAVISAVIVIIIYVLICFRRNRNVSGEKLFRSTSSTTISEFLYLGTVVNSRGIEDSRSNGNVGGGNNLDSRNLNSPELLPLPPLPRQSSVRNCENNDDEEEEEFFSPRESLEGRGSSSCTGSGSRRSLTAVGSENLGGRGSGHLSSCSCSSSSSSSPARSSAVQASPPLQHHYSTPLRSSSQSSSPERGLNQNLDESPRASNSLEQNVRSPSLSPASLSPERGLGGTPDLSLRMWNVSDRNERSDSESLVSSSPSRRSERSSDRCERSPSPSLPSSSPSRRSESNPNTSPPSPDRVSEKIPNASPRISNVSDETAQSPTRIISTSQQQVSVSLPPPPQPPPPPPTHTQRLLEAPSPSTPIGQTTCRPPPLIPPSRPFVIQKPPKVSPMGLPPSSATMEKIEETPRPKLKPLHWDKVRASSDREMVWDQLRSNSFKLNEKMIEALFVVNTPTPKQKDTTPGTVLPSPNTEDRVLDPKKSQNIAILLRALNVTTEEVCEALLEGNAGTLGAELLESLLRMAPTKEEERKLKEYRDDSPIKLGPAEKFLKAVLDVPFAFKRVDAMLYIANFASEVEYLKRSLQTLEGACEELRNSRMFMKLLEAVLKTGNRMNVGTNRGDAHAFKLDTLLKLVDVKGADGKTTLLHFVVQEIIRTEGARFPVTNQTPSSTFNGDVKCRMLGLQVVSGLSSELTNVKKAAAMDFDVLRSDVSKLSRGIDAIREVMNLIETTSVEESSEKFSKSMNSFMNAVEEEILSIQAQESVALSLVKEITEYFHGNSAKEEAHPFRIFMVVRDFLTILDRVCKEVSMINERTMVSSSHKFPVPINPTLPQAFPESHKTCRNSSSDDECVFP